MYKKTLGLFLTGALLSLCSCVDATYDLANKEITTDVEFRNNKLSLPIGSLRAFMIDSLVSDIELISTDENGVYCIRSNEELHVEKHIKPIDFKFGTKSISIEQSVPAIGVGATIKSLPVPFEFEKEFTFSDKAPNQFARIYTCQFKAEETILMNLKLEGLEAIQADAADLDLTISFPPFFKNLRSNDANVSTYENIVHITKEYLAHYNQGMEIKLYCSGFDFENDTEGSLGLEPQEIGGATYLTHQSIMEAQGKITLRNDNAGLALSGSNTQIALHVDFAFDDIEVKTIDGVFRDNFYQVDSVFAFDLGDLETTLKEVNNYIRLADPYIEMVLKNNINVPLKTIELSMFGKDEEGKVIKETEVTSNLDLRQQYDQTTGEIVSSMYKLLLTSSETLEKEGYDKIQTPNLAKWLEYVPDSIGYRVHPILDTRKRANISIDRAVSLGAACRAVIPLSFEKLDINFCDTIPVNLEEESIDVLSNVGLKLKMTITNTFPVGLSLKTTALDEKEKPISNIVFSTVSIDPCEEENCTLESTQNKKRVEIGLESESLDFSIMKNLKFEVEIFTKDDNKVGFKPTQGIQISDIAIEVSGDIKTNLNE